jgi:hypothetical protein
LNDKIADHLLDLAHVNIQILITLGGEMARYYVVIIFFI